MFTNPRRRLALAGVLAVLATGALAGSAIAADDAGSDTSPPAGIIGIL